MHKIDYSIRNRFKQYISFSSEYVFANIVCTVSFFVFTSS
jgi:hypothetical protein